jgi:hypothetical protein
MKLINQRTQTQWDDNAAMDYLDKAAEDTQKQFDDEYIEALGYLIAVNKIGADPAYWEISKMFTKQGVLNTGGLVDWRKWDDYVRSSHSPFMEGMTRSDRLLEAIDRDVRRVVRELADISPPRPAGKKPAPVVEGEKKKAKYDMQNVNGGFSMSNGVQASPGTGPDAGKLYVSVNLYGGGKPQQHAFPVPDRIRELLMATQAADQSLDPVEGDLRGELSEYYKALRKEITIAMIRLIRKFDAAAGQAIVQAVENLNRRY